MSIVINIVHQSEGTALASCPTATLYPTGHVEWRVPSNDAATSRDINSLFRNRRRNDQVFLANLELGDGRILTLLGDGASDVDDRMPVSTF